MNRDEMVKNLKNGLPVNGKTPGEQADKQSRQSLMVTLKESQTQLREVEGVYFEQLKENGNLSSYQVYKDLTEAIHHIDSAIREIGCADLWAEH